MLLATAVATLRDSLEGDVGMPDVWVEEELEFLCEIALAQVNAARPRSARDTIDMVTDTDQYALTNVWTVHRVDWLDANDKIIMQLPARAWEVWGDNETEAQTLYVSPLYARTNFSVRVHGYAPWEWSATEFPYQVQQIIIAIARAEALRRLTNERSRFRQWAQTNPRGDVSVTELLSMTNEADNQARELLSKLRIIKKPTVGRR